MKNMPFNLCLLFLIFTISGCETAIDIDVPFEKESLVINSQFNPDSIWVARVSINKNILSPQNLFTTPDNVVISVYDASTNELVDKLVHKRSGIYQGTNKPVVNRSYKLVAIHPEFGMVDATGQLPESVPVTRVTTGPVQRDKNVDVVPVDIQFKDPAGNINFYMLRLEVLRFDRIGINGDSLWTAFPIQFKSDDPILQGENEYEFDKLFSGKLVDGKVQTLGVKVNAYAFRDVQKIRVILASLSESLYLYRTTLKLQTESNGDPFSQPAFVYSNINKGLGIFAGYNIYNYTMKLN